MPATSTTDEGKKILPLTAEEEEQLRDETFRDYCIFAPEGQRLFRSLDAARAERDAERDKVAELEGLLRVVQAEAGQDLRREGE